jgi:hypothetical protein
MSDDDSNDINCHFLATRADRPGTGAALNLIREWC